MLTQKEKEFFPCDCNSHECPWETHCKETDHSNHKHFCCDCYNGHTEETRES
jgi:hypothetical protein